MTTLTFPLKVDLKHVGVSDAQFYQLCITNPDLNVERAAKGVLIFMVPDGGDRGRREADFITDLNIWNRQNKLGKVFGSSTIFKLPTGGDRSPDAAWMELSRWRALTPEQRQKFPPIAPDFVIELRSRTDGLAILQEKMQEYMDNGVKLGWVFNPQEQQVKIYRQGEAKEVRSLPPQLSGEAVLPRCNLQMDQFTDD